MQTRETIDSKQKKRVIAADSITWILTSLQQQNCPEYRTQSVSAASKIISNRHIYLKSASRTLEQPSTQAAKEKTSRKTGQLPRCKLKRRKSLRWRGARVRAPGKPSKNMREMGRLVDRFEINRPESK